MKIFWSWQSDNHQPSARYFVRDVLVQLVEELNAVDACEEAERPDADAEDDDGSRIQVDHDTSGIGGSPPIAETILRKIREAAVFVADVTPVATASSGKRLPNPNVMIELGYALNVLGHEQIVLVMNTAEAAARRHLPFDLRHWRGPVEYGLQREADDARKAEVAEELKEALRARIIPSLEQAAKIQQARRPPEPRMPKLSVMLDADQVVPIKISQNLDSLDVISLEDIKAEVSRLPSRGPATFGGPGMPSRQVRTNTFDQNVEAYYAKYQGYLQSANEHHALKLRTFTIKLKLVNSGTLPATAIDVDVNFPEGLTLYEDPDDFPEEPTPPKRPSSLSSVYDLAYVGVSANSSLLKMPRSGPTSIYPSERRVQFKAGELKHNHSVKIGDILISFSESSDIRSFDAKYTITAREPVDPIVGTIRFETVLSADE